jgi:3-phenylpropionate/trans-cinnamate dioxygenase ferredoxin reductase subunit
MLGRAQQFTGMPWFWSDQYELTLQVAGLPNSAVRTVRRKGVAGLFLFHLDEANRIVAVSALAEGNILAKDVRLSEMLIAAQTISDPELLQTEGLKLKQLAKMKVA